MRAARAALNKYPDTGDVRLYARFFKAVGLVALAQQHLIPARNALLKSVVLFPRQTEEEYVAYGALARDLFRTVVNTYNNAPASDLAISGKPAGTHVWVDGRYQGIAPLKVADLKVGDHRVTLRRSGLSAQRHFISVPPNKAAKLKFALKPCNFQQDLYQGRSVLAANFNQPTVIEDRIRELRNQLGTDQMLVIRAAFSRKHTELTGYFLAADGEFKAVETKIAMDADYLGNMSAFMAESAGTKMRPDPNKTPLDQRKSVVVSTGSATTSATQATTDPNAPLFEDSRDLEAPITSKWWFWTGVGTGVALLAGGVYLLSQDEATVAQGATGNLQVKLSRVSQ